MSLHEPNAAISDSDFTAQETTLSILSDPRQLGHGDSEHISTLPFRKCSISTKITDLRRCYFKDARLGKGSGDGELEGRREACVIVFELEFGEQVKGSGQRITDMEVWVLVEEIEEDEENAASTKTASTKPIISVPSPDLAIKAIYPRSLTGPLTSQARSTTFSGELNPSVNSISVGSVGIKHSTSHTSSHSLQYNTSPAGSQGVKINLSENSLIKSGIPARVRFAVLMQSDGLPFDVEVKFKGGARSWGVKVGGKAVVNVGRKYLWFRGGDGAEKVGKGEVRFDEDADSEGFKEWVRSKTGNAWAEGVEWE